MIWAAPSIPHLCNHSVAVVGGCPGGSAVRRPSFHERYRRGYPPEILTAVVDAFALDSGDAAVDMVRDGQAARLRLRPGRRGEMRVLGAEQVADHDAAVGNYPLLLALRVRLRHGRRLPQASTPLAVTIVGTRRRGRRGWHR
jgi:hypothetical protein